MQIGFYYRIELVTGGRAGSSGSVNNTVGECTRNWSTAGKDGSDKGVNLTLDFLVLLNGDIL